MNQRIATGSRRLSTILAPSLVAALLSAAAASAAPTTQPTPPDLSKQKTLYVVGYAHLDTQWRWAYPQVIREFIPNTMLHNFPLFEKYPHYVFNFSGSRRYEFMKEYYPADYAKLKEYVAQGRWFPCGSSVDENDANVPSAESQIRHILYGNHFFRREFGMASDEFMLPDCFGFPYALPSILSHCGIIGFSTQKLTWGSSVGIPFKVGVWQGPDGRSVMAALDPGAYSGKVRDNLARSEGWIKRVDDNGAQSGVYTDYHYYGTGDQGGAPSEDSVALIEKAVNTPGGLHVISGPADWMFKAITPAQRTHLPVYNGELLLTQHSSGSISSEAYMKRWNRKNELLADAAEKASVAAAWLGAAPYPAQRLYNAWDLVLGSQMHDILPGTSIPKAYEYSWNDELLASNQFAAVAQDAAGAVSAAMDTQAQGVPLVVYNPLSIERQDVVEATVNLPGAKSVRVFGPDGHEVPSQVLSSHNDRLHILFLASAPSVGFASYDVRPADAAPASSADLKVTQNSLENARYRVTLNPAGDVSSVFDKQLNRELLSAPSRLCFMHENPTNYPAWNMDWDDQKLPPRAYVDGPASVRILENGPVRVALEITREAQGSKFVQRIRLSAGSAGDRVEFANTIDWRTRESVLKAVFPLTASNPAATYDIQVGTVQRENDNPKKYEFPSHQWLDLTAKDNSYGASILSESKYGSDKPDDNTLRLTLLYTPGTRGGFADQGTQDFGRHDIIYCLAGHQGDWNTGGTPWRAARANQPLLSFAVPSHPGHLGKSFSLIKVSGQQVAITALKKAEDSDDVIVRLRNLAPTPAQNVTLSTASGIASAREVDGQERPLTGNTLVNDTLVTTLEPYRLRAYALKLKPAQTTSSASLSTPVQLPFDSDVATTMKSLSDGSFDSAGRSFPAEQLPKTLAVDSITFNLGSTADGQKNAVACHGQTITLPAGDFSRLYLLAAADGDQQASFDLGGKSVNLKIQNWTGYVGQWDNRVWKGDIPELVFNWSFPMVGLLPGYTKRAEVAWFATHLHNPASGNEPYHFSYLFKYSLDLPKGTTKLTLPDNPKVKLFAATLARDTHDQAVAAAPLYDTLAGRHFGAPELSPAGSFSDFTAGTIAFPLYYTESRIHYTADASEPSASSPVYSGPIGLSHTTTLKARMIQPDGTPGPVASAVYTVNDVTPPKPLSATAIGPELNVVFSEPLDKSSALSPANYAFDSGPAVESASLSADARTVTLKLASAPADSATLHISAVKDLAGNPVSGASLAVSRLAPVFRHDDLVTSSLDISNLKNLPVSASQPWTLNFLVRTNKQPANRTLIAGFGSLDDTAAQGRYLAKFANGIHFWSSRRDAESSTPLDLDKWQMLTATYDGSVLRLYKNAEKIGEQPLVFADDQPVVHLLPQDPWDHKRTFKGEVKHLTIWSAPLSDPALHALWQSEQGKQ